MMRLGDLLHGLGARILGDPATDVREIAYDSRAIPPGALFAALRGQRTDGHRYLEDAARAGAAAWLVEELRPGPAPVPVACVADTRALLGEVAARLFGYPGAALELVGVTGTNGKTSTVRMLESILSHGGRRAGSLGTISARWPGGEAPSALTTPEAPDLQRWLARMRERGVEAVALEVSSHSLALGRVRPLRFAAAVFTNLTQDHLDFHGDMARYAAAKAELFGPDYLEGPAVLNACDALTPSLAARAREARQRVVLYGRGAQVRADVRSAEEEVGLEGSRLRVEAAGERHALEVPLPGEFQVDNALAAAATAYALGLPWEAIREGLRACPPVPGRLERADPGRPAVLVDYAHTPDALERVLGSVRPLVRGRLIAVFGCGGDRDRTKRAPMARAACRNSDLAIATSDNPRTEDPEAILRDVAEGLEGSFEIVADRRAAIRRAVELAGLDDVVVIAGKGHEDYQIVGREKRPFDDRVEARRALAGRRGTPQGAAGAAPRSEAKPSGETR